MSKAKRHGSLKLLDIYIYLDMDGVLMDFDGKLRELGIENDQSFLKISKHLWTPPQQALSKAVYSCMNSRDFWASLRPLPDAMELVNQTRGLFPTVLTACPPESLCPIAKEIKKIKRAQLKKFFGFDRKHIIICERAEKVKFSESRAILIDDSTVNCCEWEEAGGNAIQHKGAKSSLAGLGSVLEALS